MPTDSQDTLRPLPGVGSADEIDELKQAIDTNDFEHVKALMTRNPGLHRGAPLGYGKAGPLTWVAECRVPWERPGPQRLNIAKWMIENGSEYPSRRRRAAHASRAWRVLRHPRKGRGPHPDDGTARRTRCGRECGMERRVPDHFRTLRDGRSRRAEMVVGSRGKSELGEVRSVHLGARLWLSNPICVPRASHCPCASNTFSRRRLSRGTKHRS